ncbi:tetracycline resistance efflux system leader peptide [Acinetobacter baumannii]
MLSTIKYSLKKMNRVQLQHISVVIPKPV